jgi:hypothetical protein
MTKFRPAWDKLKALDVQPPQMLVPLPPAEVFIPTPPLPEVFAPRRVSPLALPDFKQFGPVAPSFDAHMRDVAHNAAVIAELKSMGLGRVFVYS